MRKILTSCLIIFVLAAAIFSCCGQTKAFASLLTKHHAHDCCKKHSPSQSSTCECHHDLGILSSDLNKVQLVSHLLPTFDPLYHVSSDVSSIDLIVAVSLYANGPPDDDHPTFTPLYLKNQIFP